MVNWEFGDYLGLGAGAHGKVSFAERVMRHSRVVNVRELPSEFMLNAARLVEGFAPELFGARTGLPLATLGPGLRAAEVRGLIEHTGRAHPAERARPEVPERPAAIVPAAAGRHKPIL